MSADVLEIPTVDVDTVHDHPANPRRDAVADDELVDSVRAAGIHQPLIVAPAADGDGWVLIDGHRRKNAATRAGLTRVPVSPRYDLVTDAQQIEVMAVTGLTQATLSPVEEAAAYEQLALLGMDDAAIAAATGLGVRRVKQRMKLNALSTNAKDAVHSGEVTLADISALEEFEDDHEAYAEVERHLGTPDFRRMVHTVRSRRERDASNAAIIAELTALGAVRVDVVPGGGGLSEVDDDGQLQDAKFDQVRTLRTMPEDLTAPDTHAGHLGWSLMRGYEYATPTAYCLDTSVHPEIVAAAAPPVAESDWEKKQAEREAERVRVSAADEARREWMTAHFAAMFPTKSHRLLADFAGPWLRIEDADKQPALDATPTQVLHAFAADLAERAGDCYIDRPWQTDRQALLEALAMWDWLTGAGYPMTVVDRELRARLESRLAETTDEESNADG